MFINNLVFMVDLSCLIRFLHGLSLWKLEDCHLRMGRVDGSEELTTDDISITSEGVCLM